jgi:hypothetical protein
VFPEGLFRLGAIAESQVDQFLVLLSETGLGRGGKEFGRGSVNHGHDGDRLQPG